MSIKFKDRLVQALNENDMKQIDLVTRCQKLAEPYGIKFNRADISQYVNGKTEPAQRKLVILAQALNVSEAWLMGITNDSRRDGSMEQALNEQVLLEKYRKLSPEFKEIAMKFMNSLG